MTRSAKLAALPDRVRRADGDRDGQAGGRQARRRPSPPRSRPRTAEQVFKVLGELKGGAMKFGQAMCVFEAALPEEFAGPYRATLTRLQDAAPPMPATTVHKVLGRAFGRQLAAPVRVLRRHPRGRSLDRAGPPCGLARRSGGRGEGAVPRRRPTRCRRPQSDRPAGADVRRAWSPGWTSSPWSSRAAGSGRRGARLPLEAGSQAAFAVGVRGRRGLRRPARRRRRPRPCSSRSGSRAPPWRR